MLKKWFVISMLFFSLPSFANHPKKKKKLSNMKMKKKKKLVIQYNLSQKG
jgi:hypothetical protein